MTENYNEIKLNNEDIYVIMKQLIKLAYLVIGDNKRIEMELNSIMEKSSTFPANV